MARRTKREIMSGVDSIKAHIVDHNTIEYERENGDRVIRLHLTDIVTYKPDGKVVLNTGGWKTLTTRDRINKQLSDTTWNTWSEKNEMYLSRGWNGMDKEYVVYHWHDGITISKDRLTCDGKVYDKDRVKLMNAHQRKVKKFAKDFITAMKAHEVPAPGPGDCWFCCFVDKKKDQAWGEMGTPGRQDHIYHHIVDKYYVPSLLTRAIAMHPVAPVAEWCLAAVWGEQNERAKDFLTDSTKPHGFGGIGWEQLEKSLYRYCLHYAPYREGLMEALIEEHEEEVANG